MTRLADASLKKKERTPRRGRASVRRRLGEQTAARGLSCQDTRDRLYNLVTESQSEGALFSGASQQNVVSLT